MARADSDDERPMDVRGLRIDPGKRTVSRNGDSIPTTYVEFEILAALARSPIASRAAPARSPIRSAPPRRSSTMFPRVLGLCADIAELPPCRGSAHGESRPLFALFATFPSEALAILLCYP